MFVAHISIKTREDKKCGNRNNHGREPLIIVRGRGPSESSRG